MSSPMKDCLIEIGTEELPPKALKSLSEDFAGLVRQLLADAGLEPESVTIFATPRRLAMILNQVLTQQPDQLIEKRGPALQAAYDAEGNPSKAAQGFARSCGVEVDQLIRRETDKGSWLYFEKTEPGLGLRQLLPGVVSTAMSKLPIPKRMRWGARNDEFVRPVKWLVMMIGSELVEGEVYGSQSVACSYGHRFHAPGRIVLEDVAEYESKLFNAGYVIANFDQRRAKIRAMIDQNAATLGGVAHIDDALLDEVTGLVEYPVAVCGEFDAEFLDVPSEALVMTMQDNQKYFAVFDSDNRLLPYFITISNIDSVDPDVVARGNERVIRPRFADARFFYEQDQKHPLMQRREQLDRVVFQHQLGSIGDKTARIRQLACAIANKLGVDEALVGQAAELCKCDLMSEMVGEFPKLQGIVGRYYASHDQLPAVVCDAIEQHYWPKYAGDELPRSDVAQCIALADRLDSLVGIFAIGQKPSGVKDPFALRRAALSVVRLLVENELALDLAWLCEKSADGLVSKVDAKAAVDEVIGYIFDRLKAYYQDQGIAFDIVDAVTYARPTVLRDCDRRVQAVYRFQANEAALALAAANKRIANILKKQDFASGELDAKLLSEDAEEQLYEQLQGLEKNVRTLFSDGYYLEGLDQLASLRPAVDRFFDEVMVMVDDEAVKHNRLALLDKLLQSFRQVADFSRIQS